VLGHNRVRLQAIFITAVVLLVAVLTWLAAGENNRLETARAVHAAEQVELGGRLYHLHCRTCHGIRGEGIGQLGPPLSDEHFFKNRRKEVGWQATLAEYIVATTEHGRMMGTRPIYAGNGSTAVMAPWHQRYGGGLRSDEIDALKTFILNWEATAVGEVVLSVLELPEIDAGSPEVIARGRQVFKKRCSGCHKFEDIPAAEPVGPDLGALKSSWSGKGLDMKPDEYIRESVLIPAARIAEGFETQADSRPCGAVLTEADLTAVSAYLLD